MVAFQLNDQTFEAGDTLIVTTPEFGTIEVQATVQGFSHGRVLGLDFGLIKTPHICLAYLEAQPTARLSFYTNGMGYTTLQLAFHCSCRNEAHPRGIEWDVRVEGNTITAGPARQEKRRVPAPITPPPPTVIARPATATPIPKKVAEKPKGKDSNDGQLSFF